MTDATNQLRQLLQAAGYSMTKPRLVVFRALQEDSPLSMAQLVKATRAKIDRASVYRTVALFEKLGVVQRLQTGWKYRLELCDAFSQHHHHLSCLKCGANIASVDDTKLEAEISALAKIHQFKMHAHQLEILGLCAACQ